MKGKLQSIMPMVCPYAKVFIGLILTLVYILHDFISELEILLGINDLEFGSNLRVRMWFSFDDFFNGAYSPITFTDD